MPSFSLTVKTKPKAEPVALDIVKSHLRIDHGLDDGYLTFLINAATRRAEKETKRALITQTLVAVFDLTKDHRGSPLAGTLGAGVTGTIEMPRPPLQSVTSVATESEYMAVDWVNLAATEYKVDIQSIPGILYPVDANWGGSGWDCTGRLKVEYVCGYGNDPGDVPEEIQLGILMLASHWYENREAVSDSEKFPLREGVRELFETARIYKI